MDLESFFSGPALYIAYIMAILGVVAIVVGFVITSIGEPKKLIKFFAGLAILGIVLLIGYSLAGGEVTDKYVIYNVTTESGSKLIGGILTMTYLLLGVAVVATVAGWIMKLVN